MGHVRPRRPVHPAELGTGAQRPGRHHAAEHRQDTGDGHTAHPGPGVGLGTGVRERGGRPGGDRHGVRPVAGIPVRLVGDAQHLRRARLPTEGGVPAGEVSPVREGRRVHGDAHLPAAVLHVPHGAAQLRRDEHVRLRAAPAVLRGGRQVLVRHRHRQRGPGAHVEPLGRGLHPVLGDAVGQALRDPELDPVLRLRGDRGDPGGAEAHGRRRGEGRDPGPARRPDAPVPEQPRGQRPVRSVVRLGASLNVSHAGTSLPGGARLRPGVPGLPRGRAAPPPPARR